MEHPITPPPELVQQWWKEADKQLSPYYDYIATQAARWGADQELEACCVVVDNATVVPLDAGQWLRATRRPKPPSLAEQALALISHDPDDQPFLSEEGIAIIRRALERLQELEKGNE